MRDKAGQPHPRRGRRRKTSELIHTPLFKYFLVPLTFAMFQMLIRLVDSLGPADAYRLARMIAVVFWWLVPKHRLHAYRNIELAYGDRFSPKERRRVARRVMQHFMCSIVDLALLPRYYRSGRWREILEVSDEQMEELHFIRDFDGPVAFHTAHVGAWEFTAALAGIVGEPLAFVYRPLDHPDVDRVLREYRTIFPGYEAIPKKGALRGYTRAMRRKMWLGVIADQNAGSKAAFLPFLGVPAATEVTYFKLYQRFMPLVRCCFITRDGFNFRFKLHGPYKTDVRPDADPNEESMRLARWYLDCVEDIARKYPEQYLWTHRRYASRPAGVPSVYRNLGGEIDPALLEAQPKEPLLPLKDREDHA